VKAGDTVSITLPDGTAYNVPFYALNADAAPEGAGAGRTAYDWFAEGTHVEARGGPAADVDARAEACYRKAVALDPKLPLAHFLLGEIALYHSKIPEAIEEFQKELELNPGYAATRLRRAQCRSAS